MYQKIDYNELGGLPLTQEIMDFMQNSYNEVFESITEVIGTYAIISGVALSAGNYGAGWLSIDGEIVPFEAAPASQGTKISVFPSATSIEFGNGDIKPVIITRRAILGTTGVDLSLFTRITLPQLQTDLTSTTNIANNALTIANNAAATTIPTGVILIWSGSIASIPSGWGLCDGTDGKPNLRSRFIIGAESSGTYTVGATGGASFVQLTISEMPSHNHTILIDGDHNHFVKEVNRGEEGSSGIDQSVGSYTEAGEIKNTSFSGNHTHLMNNTGFGIAHENRPPYYALAYIIKL